MDKIILNIFGGIGNQLFSYAAARRLALVNDAELVIDNVSGFSRDVQYKRSYQLHHFNISCRLASFSERLMPCSRIRRFLMRKWNSRLLFDKRKYVVQSGVDFDSRLLNFKSRGTIYLEGFWQSEGYFKDIEETIRQELSIQPPVDIANQNLAEKIQKHNAVALHVRFFDNPNTDASTHNTSNDYYSRAIDLIESHISDAHYYIFSDNFDLVSSYISLPHGRFSFVNHNQGDNNAYADLWLMTQCKHFIIANSTFSWWGAWLSGNKDKIVIAPNLVLGGKTAWGFSGLLPDSWLKV